MGISRFAHSLVVCDMYNARHGAQGVQVPLPSDGGSGARAGADLRLRPVRIQRGACAANPSMVRSAQAHGPCRNGSALGVEEEGPGEVLAGRRFLRSAPTGTAAPECGLCDLLRGSRQIPTFFIASTTDRGPHSAEVASGGSTVTSRSPRWTRPVGAEPTGATVTMAPADHSFISFSTGQRSLGIPGFSRGEGVKCLIPPEGAARAEDPNGGGSSAPFLRL